MESKKILANKKTLALAFILLSLSFYLIYTKVMADQRAANDLQIKKGKITLSERQLIAHGSGGIEGEVYTNSIDALNYNYRIGYRLFEIDLQFTKDSILVAAHDWQQYFNEQGERNESQPTFSEFKNLRLKNSYTKITLQLLEKWIAEHKDALIIVDLKSDPEQSMRYIAKNFPSLTSKTIPEIFDLKDYKLIKQLGFYSGMPSLYKLKVPEEVLLEFVKNAKPFGVAMPEDIPNNSDLAFKLSELGTPSFVHTINSNKKVEHFHNRGVTGFYSDFLVP